MWSNQLYNAANKEKAFKIDSWSGWKELEEKKMVEKESRKLEVGEKFLSIQFEFGGQRFHLAAFKNKGKQKFSEPDYKGHDVAVWIASKKPGKEEQRVEDL